MKVGLTFAAFLLVPSLVIAEPASLEGFNLGLGVGYTRPTVTYTDVQGGDYRWNRPDFVSRIDASYAVAANEQWLIGFGMTADMNKMDAGTKSEKYGAVNTSLKEHMSVYVEPAYLLDDTSAVFAKIGYHSAKLDATGLNGAGWLDDHIRIHGIGYGIGYKKMVSKNWFVQAELEVVNYKKKMLTSPPQAWDYKAKTTAAIVTLGYKF